MDRTPRRHEAGSSVKAGTAAALITDHEGKAVAARVPYFHVLDGTNDAGELHSHSTAVGHPRHAQGWRSWMRTERVGRLFQHSSLRSRDQPLGRLRGGQSPLN